MVIAGVLFFGAFLMALGILIHTLFEKKE